MSLVHNLTTHGIVVRSSWSLHVSSKSDEAPDVGGELSISMNIATSTAVNILDVRRARCNHNTNLDPILVCISFPGIQMNAPRTPALCRERRLS